MLDRKTIQILAIFASGEERDYWSNGLGLLNTLDEWEGDWTDKQVHFYDQLEDRLNDYAWYENTLFRVKFKGIPMKSKVVFTRPKLDL